MLTLETIMAIGHELAKVNPSKLPAYDPLADRAARSQWETDILAVADGFPLTGSAVKNKSRRDSFLTACGLNQSPL